VLGLLVENEVSNPKIMKSTLKIYAQGFPLSLVMPYTNLLRAKEKEMKKRN
jgi:hypothetical protein